MRRPSAVKFFSVQMYSVRKNTACPLSAKTVRMEQAAGKPGLRSTRESPDSATVYVDSARCMREIPAERIRINVKIVIGNPIGYTLTFPDVFYIIDTNDIICKEKSHEKTRTMHHSRHASALCLLRRWRNGNDGHSRRRGEYGNRRGNRGGIHRRHDGHISIRRLRLRRIRIPRSLSRSRRALLLSYKIRPQRSVRGGAERRSHERRDLSAQCDGGGSALHQGYAGLVHGRHERDHIHAQSGDRRGQ